MLSIRSLLILVKALLIKMPRLYRSKYLEALKVQTTYWQSLRAYMPQRLIPLLHSLCFMSN